MSLRLLCLVPLVLGPICALRSLDADQIDNLPLLEPAASSPAADWLIDESSYKADVYRTENPDEIVLDNGLLRRTFRIAPNGATVGLDNLMTGQAVLRGVKPEALVTIDGMPYEVGGLKGQPNYAYLLPEWLDAMTADPAAFRFVGFQVGRATPRFAWKQVRHHAPDAAWPPPGVHLQMDYAPPDGEVSDAALADQAAQIAQAKSIRLSVHYELYDATDRERRGLSLRRMYRTIAPWVTENPLMMHMRTADPAAVRAAIDQCAAVGFEMLILSFGSGFNIENDSPQYMQQCSELAAYAQERGIEIGGYSLLASRSVGGGNDVVSPPGESPTFGRCPALTSPWGQEYFRKLYEFFEKTGFSLLEHDGSYPGDRDVTARPPLQKGVDDSQWVQWRIISDFYKWCRARGIYLNVPDYYYLAGSNKCGMGYRETNWSLPREQQVIHTRQNIYDGVWNKTPSMGWMFVPLTPYHGGGAAATIEPLDQHRDHYERMLTSNLAMGVQACYRGPRLYDTDRTEALVKMWVAWFKQYRDILESDLVHGRRADGRDLDWMLHVNPKLKQKGMLVVFNPLKKSVQKTLRVNLYYTGLTDRAQVRDAAGGTQSYTLSRDHSIEIPVRVSPEGFAWFVIQ